MHIRITSDSNEESGVGLVVDQVSGPARRYFSEKQYGDGLYGIVAVLICRDPDLRFKPRLRFSKRDNILYMDVMLDLARMVQASLQDRKQIVLDRLGDEIPATLRKYSFLDFDDTRFVEDLRNWLVGLKT
jgi:hypothetical protein